MAIMFRFDRLIPPDMLIRDVKQQYPITTKVLEEFGFRSICDDCDIETGARKNGVSSRGTTEGEWVQRISPAAIVGHPYYVYDVR